MKIRLLPNVSGERGEHVLREAAIAFENVRGGNHTGIDIYNEYLRKSSDQVRMLASVLPAADLNRLLTTPRYWMLHSVDPAGKVPVLASLMSVELDEKIRVLEEAAKSLADDRRAFSGADLVVVPDTNLLLHHPQSVRSVPWELLAPAETRRIILAIPMLVIDELDNAKRRTEKIENGTESIRTRAGRTLAIFEQWFKSGASYCLAPGLMEALNPRQDESHGGTEEVPRGASGACDPAGGRGAA